jgi:hypothetical protein
MLASRREEAGGPEPVRSGPVPACNSAQIREWRGGRNGNTDLSFPQFEIDSLTLAFATPQWRVVV